MLAELHGKISRTASNLTDRSEDELTGNFLGHLRYLPFEQGFGAVLRQAVRPAALADQFASTTLDYWADRLSFWPRYQDQESNVELDALLSLDSALIGLEFKLYSNLSSDDEINNDHSDNNELSCNQLAKEARIISAQRRSDQQGLLLLIADQNACRAIYADVQSRKLLPPDITLGCLSWQDILTALQTLRPSDAYSQLILSDLQSLLIAKGFQHFRSMALDDCPNIAADDYFRYASSAAARLTPFTLDYPQSVDQGDYYEYR